MTIQLNGKAATQEQIDAIGLELSAGKAVGPLAAQVRGGPLKNGEWAKLPSMCKLLLDGTGTVTIDTRARDGTITTSVAAYNVVGPAEDYPYFDNAYEVRATLTGTATAEIV